MVKNLALLVIILVFGIELYFSTKGSQHRKKKHLKNWNLVKGVISAIEKKQDERTGKTYYELTIETETERTVTVKEGIFSIYEVGEEVTLQELKGYHKFIGNDRVDKQGKKELLLGTVPMLLVIAVCAVLTFVVS
ncbi:MAG: hypothetical protein IJ703_09415 [Eubacterium sp.]|nr:hypothetical protein [Eubacterium sp.]